MNDDLGLSQPSISDNTKNYSTFIILLCCCLFPIKYIKCACMVNNNKKKEYIHIYNVFVREPHLLTKMKALSSSRSELLSDWSQISLKLRLAKLRYIRSFLR